MVSDRWRHGSYLLVLALVVLQGGQISQVTLQGLNPLLVFSLQLRLLLALLLQVVDVLVSTADLHKYHKNKWLVTVTTTSSFNNFLAVIEDAKMTMLATNVSQLYSCDYTVTATVWQFNTLNCYILLTYQLYARHLLSMRLNIFLFFVRMSPFSFSSI